jgi:hypothetical protein
MQFGGYHGKGHSGRSRKEQPVPREDQLGCRVLLVQHGFTVTVYRALVRVMVPAASIFCVTAPEYRPAFLPLIVTLNVAAVPSRGGSRQGS